MVSSAVAGTCEIGASEGYEDEDCPRMSLVYREGLLLCATHALELGSSKPAATMVDRESA